MSVTKISPLSRRPISPARSLSIHLPLGHNADRSTSIQASSVDHIINGPIREVFFKHTAHLTVCLYLQHRHHTVGAGETIVKVEGTAHLMDGEAIEDIVSFGNKVVPSTRVAAGDAVLPMEIAVVPTGDVLCVSYFLIAVFLAFDRP